LRLGTLVPMNIEVPTKYPLSQDRMVVFENRLHSESPIFYRPALHDNWNALSLAKRALKDKFPTPTVPLTAVFQNRQVFLPDLIQYNLSAKLKHTLLSALVFYEIFSLFWSANITLLFVQVFKIHPVYIIIPKNEDCNKSYHTGHNALKRYLYLMRLSDSPLCRRCGAQDEIFGPHSLWVWSFDFTQTCVSVRVPSFWSQRTLRV
jgi:hypothetical protein